MSKMKKRKIDASDLVGNPKRTKSVINGHNLETSGSRITDSNSTGKSEQVIGKSTNKKSIPSTRQSLSSGIEEASEHKGEKSLGVVVHARSKAAESWHLSLPIGGRMVRTDPVFTADEKFLIVATRTTVQVIAVANSLLIRSIKLKLDQSTTATHQIVTTCLSPSNPNIVWVAYSNGSVFKVDWATGDGADSFWIVSSTGCLHMTVASIGSHGRKRDVIFTTANRKDGKYRTTANELANPNDSISTASRTIYTSKEPIQFLRAAINGSVIVGASGKRILVGRLRSTEFDTVDKIKYEFRSLESRDFIISLDLRLSQRLDPQIPLKNKVHDIPIVDLVVGNNRGIIFIHNDIARKLFSQPQNEIVSSTSGWMSAKLHWHRQAVNSVKWSLDGNYVISGGKETVLVLWQLETGKRQYLPHLSGVIENIVVSPKGSAYAIQLSDNSTMVLSTADLLPKMNIAGIQAPIIQSSDLMESSILRTKGKSWPKPLIQRIPAIVNPVKPSKILLAVGSLGEVEAKKPLIMSNPFLQTFELTTCKSISTQALTRTNVTNVNTAPTASSLIEPRVIHLKISFDGLWLATVDEWTPPDHDYDFLKCSGKDFSEEATHRREVYLKFWQWNTSTGLWELVSRIDIPHLLSDESGDSGTILDLVSDPTCHRFATIGSDKTVKIWSTKSKKRDGILVRDSLKNIIKSWACIHTVKLERVNIVDLDGKSSCKTPMTGCISFSEDGSVLAAAIGGENALLHFIDPEYGTIRISHPGLIEDEICGLEFLGQDLIILSNKLQSFDVVSEEIRHAFKLRPVIECLSIDQKREMIHLAIDVQSKTFAIALPKLSSGPEQLVGARSELVVFHQDIQKPMFKDMFPCLITALLPTVCSEGYLTIDASAEIHTVLRKGSQAITSLAQSTSALQLDAAILSDELPIISLPPEPEEEEEEQMLNKYEENDEEFPVVTQHQLAQVFDVGPAFALPPIEELFYQVASLFTSKPLI